MSTESQDQRDLEAEREELIARAQETFSPELRDAIAIAQSVRPPDPKTQLTTTSSGSADAHSQ